MKDMPIVALMYDFDRTLSPRDMEEYAFIPGLGMSAAEFWSRCNETAIRYEMDGILAYMLMMLQLSEGKQLVTRGTLNAVGKHVELFPASTLTRRRKGFRQNITASPPGSKRSSKEHPSPISSRRSMLPRSATTTTACLSGLRQPSIIHQKRSLSTASIKVCWISMRTSC